MPGVDVSTITPDYAFTSCNLRVGNGSEVWLSPSTITCSLSSSSLLPSEYTITTTGSTAADATSIAVSATGVKLYKYDVLFFTPSNVLVVVSADTAAGATSIPIFAATATIASAATAKTYGMVPLYSVNNAAVSIGGNTINSRLFSAPVWELQRTVSKNFNLTLSGDRVNTDPGAAVLDAAAKSLNYLYFEVRQPKAYGNLGFLGSGTVNDHSYTIAIDAHDSVSYTVTGSGQLGSYKPLGMS